MTVKNRQQGLDRLADVLVEDILCTPGDKLLAEVAEDYGNPRAFADSFDKVVSRARSSHDGLVAKASPAVATQVLGGSQPESESSSLAERLRALWQNVISSIFDFIFPNRLVMIGISSACIASLAVIAAAPKFFDRDLAQHSGVSDGTKTSDGGSTGPQPGGASERGVTRGLVPAPSSVSPAVPRGVYGAPSPEPTPSGADG